MGIQIAISADIPELIAKVDDTCINNMKTVEQSKRTIKYLSNKMNNQKIQRLVLKEEIYKAFLIFPINSAKSFV